MRQYIVDAFTDKVFKGNPAAVLVLETPLPEELMASIAAENNLSETAFAVKEKESGPNGSSLYHLRWLTPVAEVDLCGHATLATSYVIFNYIEPVPEERKTEERMLSFRTRSGLLTVTKRGDMMEMEFNAFSLHRVDVTPAMTAAIGVQPLEAHLGRDLLCVLPDEKTVRELKVDQEKVRQLDGMLLNVTAAAVTPGYDCVSRTFAPKHDIPEDPVCGSGHCHIAPYWAQRLGKTKLTAYQASRRGGTLLCDLSTPGKVRLSGQAALFAIAELQCC